ncbi:putative protoporphyrinogen oxidase [Candidatus Protochlamydia naegleriophila]|uniref:Coproporphyrinogen III oxidase n=1 Tax=Candidatus Protochlamydia naegleriophila TaxID=389348 RepID=A0A0U5JDS3_9BACT|nr:protoporphyrinogen oxidase [Candidatus Protochlamydia naegleriophila]CUI17662.1 putative protoporphyrinogen oxidase [Candidatus Protochlamydia naegleriophila]
MVRPKQIVILGAGISGLTTAWFLKQFLDEAVRITVVEKSCRAGGWIESLRLQEFLFEQGPRSCRTKGNGRETLRLVEELGLQDQIIAAHPSARSRFVYHQKSLHSLPSHPLAMPFNPLMKGWLKACWRDWTSPKSAEEDESLYAFFSRRLGSDWCNRLIDPFISGIYAGDSRKLSIQSCFPVLWQWEQEHGSLLKGAWRHPRRPPSESAFVSKWEKEPIFSFKQGMERLTNELAKQLEEIIRFSCEPKAIQFTSKEVRITLTSGEQIEADHVISAIPALSLAPLLASHSTLAEQLQAIPYATLMVVNLGYRKKILKSDGFGYLIPSQEKEAILGCVFDSCVFPQQNACEEETRLTVMIGGTRYPEVETYSEKRGKEIALEAMQNHLGIDAEPDVAYVRLARQAIPQYEVGHQHLLSSLRRQLASLQRLTLTGNSFDGVSVNDRVAQARILAEDFARSSS